MSTTNTVKFTDGIMMLIEADKTGEWFYAKPWQFSRFIDAMKFGTMKSMGAPNPKEITKRFTENGMTYRFIIENDWGPCFIENVTTGKIRKIQYFELGNFMKNREIKKSLIKF